MWYFQQTYDIWYLWVAINLIANRIAKLYSIIYIQLNYNSQHLFALNDKPLLQQEIISLYSIINH